MVLWRISNYADLHGTGGLLAAGRWHSKGHPVVYYALNPAAALLESLVHFQIDAEDRPERFQILKIEGPDTLSTQVANPAQLRRDWREDFLSTQSIGDEWLGSRRSLLLHVPSALVPETWNVLVSPTHTEAGLLKIAKIYQHPFDTRFFNKE